MRKLLLGTLLCTFILLFGCSNDDSPVEETISHPVENFYNTTTEIGLNHFNGQTLKWLLIERIYVQATRSELFTIKQDVDFNFYNNTKVKSRVNKVQGSTIINPQWDIIYTVQSVRLVRKIGSINGEVSVTPTYNTAGFPRKEFYLRNDSNGEISYYTVGSDNKIKTQ